MEAVSDTTIGNSFNMEYDSRDSRTSTSRDTDQLKINIFMRGGPYTETRSERSTRSNSKRIIWRQLRGVLDLPWIAVEHGHESQRTADDIMNLTGNWHRRRKR